jgi:hypothetical protein
MTIIDPRAHSLAVGVLLYLTEGRTKPESPAFGVTWLRIVHGGTALCLLCGFLIAHLINHDLAVWSVTLHRAVMNFLRLWYRSEWVQPLLLGLLAVMICTGVPLVAHHSRRRMDAFRVAQAATGVYTGAFVCSHVLATLNGRRMGIETDWSFAVGSTSLLDGIGLRGMFMVVTELWRPCKPGKAATYGYTRCCAATVFGARSARSHSQTIDAVG